MHRLFRPLDIASLVAFRLAFGALMLCAVGRYFAHGWIDQFFVAPRLFFPYPGLAWLAPLPHGGMYLLYALLGALALCVLLGLWYRASAALFCIGFSYAHLIDRTNYLNHYHLVTLLSLLLVFVPAHRAYSLDVWRGTAPRRATAPAWSIWILRFQLGVVYVFGAVAKLNPDWLLTAQPLRIWLGANVDTPIVGALFEQAWVAYAFSYAGLLFDLSIVPLLLWRRTRAAAYGELDIPVIYVSHSLDEVARLADQLVLMEQGRVVASGALNEVLGRLDLPTAHLDDAGAVIEAGVAAHDEEYHLTRLDFSGGSLWVSKVERAIGSVVRARVLARDVSIATAMPHGSSISNILEARIDEIRDEGPDRVNLRMSVGSGKLLLSRITRRSRDQLGLARGMEVFAQVKSVALIA